MFCLISVGAPGRLRAAAGFASALLLASELAHATPPAGASPQDPGAQAADSDDDTRRAAAEFKEGTRAFEGGDFRLAAQCFERAHAAKPHPSVLWNAARAWQKAGDAPRAATLYDLYLKDAPASARDRNTATMALAELRGRLGRIELVIGEGVAGVRVDGEALGTNPRSALFVTPGAHRIEATHGRGPVLREVTVSAGESTSVSLAPPPETEHVEIVPPLPAATPPPPPTRRGWSPAVVVVGSIATAVGAGVTIASGIDTLAAKAAFDANPSSFELLSKGRQKQDRTNIALGITTGVAAFTAIAALLFVEWRPSKRTGAMDPSVRFGAGPASASIVGTF